jgi:hypothetical protein
MSADVVRSLEEVRPRDSVVIDWGIFRLRSVIALVAALLNIITPKRRAGGKNAGSPRPG